MNLIPYLWFHLNILGRSRTLARHSSSTYRCPRSIEAGWFLSGRFLVACSGLVGSFKGYRCSRIDAIRQVRDVNTGGFENRR